MPIIFLIRKSNILLFIEVCVLIKNSIYKILIKNFTKKILIKNFVLGSGFRVPGSGFRVLGSGFRVPGSGFWVLGSGFQVPGSEFRVSQSSGFRVSGTPLLFMGNNSLSKRFSIHPLSSTHLLLFYIETETVDDVYNFL